MAKYEFVENDTGSILKVTCTDSAGTAIDLTNSTIKLYYKINGCTTVTKTMQTVTAVSGICQYQFTTSELVAGEMRAEIEITDGALKVTSSLEELVFNIRDRI